VFSAYPMTACPQSKRVEFFRGVIDRVFCAMQIDPHVRERPFAGIVAVRTLHSIRMAYVATTACSVRRRAQDIARLHKAEYLVKFLLSGRAVWIQRGREVHLLPGDFVICSTQEPYSLRFMGDYSMPVLALDETQMRRLAPNPDRFLGIRMHGGDVDCGLLSSFVGEFVMRLGRMPESMMPRIEAGMLDLLGAVLSRPEEASPLSAGSQRERIKRYVRQHLRDPGLCPAQIAADLGISIRYVHTLFKAESLTLGRYIRALRVSACREDLETQQGAPQSLTETALKWGFYDLSHMSRCFRETFAQSPGEIRLRAMQSGALPVPRNHHG
jgi:AraC family transcriptional activator of tynA and feaB